MINKKIKLGRHLLIELIIDNKYILNDVEYAKNFLIEAIKQTGAEIKSIDFVKFEPQGLSGVIIISESHLSIHTWPEYNLAILDIFTCGKINPWKAISYLVDNLEVKNLVVHEVPRYFPSIACVI